MKNFKNLFFLSILFTIFSISFIVETQAQSSTDNDARIIFNPEDMSQWRIAQLPAQLPNGNVLLAIFKADGTQIIAKIRRGRIVQIGEKIRGRSIRAIEQQKTPYSVVRNCGMAYNYIWCSTYSFHGNIYGYCLCMGDYAPNN